MAAEKNARAGSYPSPASRALEGSHGIHGCHPFERSTAIALLGVPVRIIFALIASRAANASATVACSLCTVPCRFLSGPPVPLGEGAPPPPEGRCAADQAPRLAKWVVFPHYEADSETVVIRLTQAQGLGRLLDESLVLPDVLDHQKAGRLIGWARQLAFYHLHMSSLETGVRTVHDLISGPQSVQQMSSRDWDQ